MKPYRQIVLLLPVTFALISLVGTARPRQSSIGAPTITELSPNTAPAGRAFGFNVRGSGFVSGRSFVLWNGQRLSTQFIDATTLFTFVPDNQAIQGDATVQVENTLPGSGVSNSLTFTVGPPAPNPAPTLRALSPASAVAGAAGVTVTVIVDSLPGAVIRWNGQERPSTRMSELVMSLSLSASDLAAPGLNYITVANPAPGGGSSAALRFTVYRDTVLAIQTDKR